MLLIDDDMVSREVMATVLTMSGYTVYTATDGAASLKMLEEGVCQPGVVLMDAQMPGLSGAALIAELRARTHAVIFTISASQPQKELVAVADGFLLKPFNPDDLRNLLKKLEPQNASPAAPALDEPVVDAEKLAQLREMMPEAKVREIYATIVTDLNRRLQLLEAALVEGDDAEIRRIGHAIKGGCAMVGAQQASSLGALLEAEGNHLDNNPVILHDLRSATDNLERMLGAGFLA